MIDEQIYKILQELNSEVKDALEKVSKDLAKEGADKVKKLSPRRTGKYAQGWRQRKNGDTLVIYNANKPNLTHLLEKGYTAKNGRRVSGKKHIGVVQDYIDQEIVRRIEKELS